MLNCQVKFEYDEYNHEIVMKIMNKDQVVFYEIVTQGVIDVAQTYSNRKV